MNMLMIPGCKHIMIKTLLLSITAVLLTLSAIAYAQQDDTEETSPSLSTAIFAGGCFWCIEADFEKLEGVKEVVSGYTGGSSDTADYKTVTYEKTGHLEAVQVSYDPKLVSYSKLVDYFWRHIDPTDPNGQFCDKGHSYLSALYYSNEEEQKIAQQSLADLQVNKPFEADIVTPVLPAKAFYLAEEYHQDYYKKNPIRYGFYRRGCGRDNRVNELWGSEK